MTEAKWPKIEEHPAISGDWSCDWYSAPHECDVPGCPGPKLVGKLEAAEKMAEALRSAINSIESEWGDGHAEAQEDALEAWAAANRQPPCHP